MCIQRKDILPKMHISEQWPNEWKVSRNVSNNDFDKQILTISLLPFCLSPLSATIATTHFHFRRLGLIQSQIKSLESIQLSCMISKPISIRFGAFTIQIHGFSLMKSSARMKLSATQTPSNLTTGKPFHPLSKAFSSKMRSSQPLKEF